MYFFLFHDDDNDHNDNDDDNDENCRWNTWTLPADEILEYSLVSNILCKVRVTKIVDIRDCICYLSCFLAGGIVEEIGDSTSHLWFRKYYIIFCQPQAKPQLQLCWPKLNLISNSSHPSTQPPGKVYFWASSQLGSFTNINNS